MKSCTSCTSEHSSLHKQCTALTSSTKGAPWHVPKCNLYTQISWRIYMQECSGRRQVAFKCQEICQTFLAKVIISGKLTLHVCVCAVVVVGKFVTFSRIVKAVIVLLLPCFRHGCALNPTACCFRSQLQLPLAPSTAFDRSHINSSPYCVENYYLHMQHCG